MTCEHPIADMAGNVTQEMIADGMARIKKVACRPGDDRRYPLPYEVASAQQACTPKGRCTIGPEGSSWPKGTGHPQRLDQGHSGRKAWDVWLDLHTGAGRLRRRRPRFDTNPPPATAQLSTVRHG
jgi:hypothetical protein